MDLENDALLFLRDLVKTSRQKIHPVKWVDRDGTERLTVLNQLECTRLNAIAREQKKSAGELLRQAAHIPVPR